MNKHLATLKAKYTSTEYPAWKNVAVTIILTVTCTLVVSIFWYLYFSTGTLGCYRGFLYLSIVWLLIELVLIAFLFRYKTIPRFAREAIGAIIGMSNIWFILFVFSLQACEG